MTHRAIPKARRILSLAILLSMLVALAAGCAPADPGQSTTPPQTTGTTGAAATAKPDAVPVTEEEYTFRIAPIMSAPVEADSVMELYWEERLGVQFDLVYYEPAQYAELLSLDISTGDTPDVFKTGNVSEVVKYYNQGVLGGFSREFLQENSPALYEHILNSSGDIGFSVPTMEDGLIYSLPGAGLDQMIPAPVIWNLDWLEAVGFEGIPRTLEEVEEVFYQFRNGDPDGNGQKDTYGLSASGMNSIYGAFGVMPDRWLEDENGELVYDVANPKAKDALALLAKWYQDGVLDPEYITGENKGGYWANSNAFCEERIGFTNLGVYYHWYPQDFLESTGRVAIGSAELLASVNPELRFTFGYPPVGPNGEAGSEGKQNLLFFPGFSKELVADTPRFVKMLDIIATCSGVYDPMDFVTQKYGIQGEHFDFNEHNIPIAFDEFATVEGMSKIGANTTFMWMDTIQGRSLCQPDLYEYFNMGLFADPDRSRCYVSKLYAPLQSEADYKEETVKILTEMKIAIITGEKDIDYWDTAIAEYYKAGGEVLKSEANEWYSSQK